MLWADRLKWMKNNMGEKQNESEPHIGLTFDELMERLGSEPRELPKLKNLLDSPSPFVDEEKHDRG